MEQLQNTFIQCKRECRAALVTFVTAGFPTTTDTPDIMLGMQAGGADIIELGIPFADPIGDGPVIQQSHLQALENGVTISSMLSMVEVARKQGLNIPVLFMGYYNPVMCYGISKFLADCKEAGVNGFIIVDLPLEEAVEFRNGCVEIGLSYVPLIPPSTPDDRIKLLCDIADSFIYIVSRMGATGTTDTLSADLPHLVRRVTRHSGGIPKVIGFGISTREHFLQVASVADGAVIGSQIIKTMYDAQVPSESVKQFCKHITARKDVQAVSKFVPSGESTTLLPIQKSIFAKQRGRFGNFGGQFVPEALMPCLTELEEGFNAAIDDPEFWEEYRSYDTYIGRPSHLHLATRLTEYTKGVNIWLKREDLNHTGSHKINNALGQILIARRLGKTEIIAETGAGSHGLATATICAKFGMKCTIYMGAEDFKRQDYNVFQIRLLGATVVPVKTRCGTLQDAVNEAFRAWIAKFQTTHYIIGSAIGPHPFPTMVRTFQSVIGDETKAQLLMEAGKLPDAVVACVGGGSNAVGMFYAFKDLPVRLLGVEAAGDGLETSRHSATLFRGSVGILHGARTYVLQDTNGQTSDTYSMSAELDYPGVGPELAHWKESGRMDLLCIEDVDALSGLRLLMELEGIVPAVDTCHAVVGAILLAHKLDPGQNIVLCLNGRGDQDLPTVANEFRGAWMDGI